MEGLHRDEAAEKIIDATLAEAEVAGGWHHVSLRRVAGSLGIVVGERMPALMQGSAGCKFPLSLRMLTGASSRPVPPDQDAGVLWDWRQVDQS